MSDPAELERLAGRYLDLWQDQMSALARDPELALAIGRAYELAAGGMALFMAGLQTIAAGGARGTADNAEPAPQARSAAPPGSTPAAAAPDGAGGDAALLARRVAELEERILRLESGDAATGRGPRRRA